MRILAAFDKFKDSFSAEKACEIVGQASLEIDFQSEVTPCPLTDGGDGFVSILGSCVKGDFIDRIARDSLGVGKQVSFSIVNISELSKDVRNSLELPETGKLAILEMASVCGLQDLDLAQRDPWKTSTVGIGDLLLSSKDCGADFILLGIGGSSTNDMGIGALTSLGLKVTDKKGGEVLLPSPEFWNEVSKIEVTKMKSLPPILIACDVDNTLLGPAGATHQFGSQKGLINDRVEELEEQMVKMTARLSHCFPKAPLKTKDPGSGAAGGIGYGLSLAYDVKFVRGFELVSKWLNIEQAVTRSDLVLCGEGRFDQTSLGGKGPFEILRLAQKHKKPTVLVCGSIETEIIEQLKSSFPLLSCSVLADPSVKLEQNLLQGPDTFLRVCKDEIRFAKENLKVNFSDERDLKFKRIRRLKKLLRPLPRRSNIHKYPVLKWFADTAYRRSYLWSFKGKEVRSALFFGIWISMLPIVGIQMLVVFFFALLVRANLPIIVALQWISNPLTMGPIYFADYKIGMTLIELMNLDYPGNRLLSSDYDWAQFSYRELLRLLDTFPPMLVGGSVLGISLGVIAVFLYKLFSKIYK